MRGNVVSNAISMIILTLVLVVTPFYLISIAENVRSDYAVMSETRNLIDEVIDSRTLTDDMLADYNLALASQSDAYRATITREVKVVNPDPQNPGNPSDPNDKGSYYTSYQVVDDNRTYNQGDRIVVDIDTVETSFLRNMVRYITNLYHGSSDFTFTGRVR